MHIIGHDALRHSVPQAFQLFIEHAKHNTYEMVKVQYPAALTPIRESERHIVCIDSDASGKVVRGTLQ